nr:hypothetical protein [Spirosoma agri]
MTICRLRFAEMGLPLSLQVVIADELVSPHEALLDSCGLILI